MRGLIRSAAPFGTAARAQAARFGTPRNLLHAQRARGIETWRSAAQLHWEKQDSRHVKIGRMDDRWAIRKIGRPAHIAIIGICIVVLASCDWTIPSHYVLAHNILHHLNFIP